MKQASALNAVSDVFRPMKIHYLQSVGGGPPADNRTGATYTSPATGESESAPEYPNPG
jgi:hypothetical protein